MLELKHHVINGRVTQAKKLLTISQLAMEDCADEDANTPLHWCAQGLGVDTEKRSATDEEVFAFVMQNGAPKNRQNNLGETPLMTAVRLAVGELDRAEKLIEEMLKKGLVDPCRGDISGETPLMEAAAAGLENVGKLLLEYRANPLAESSSGLTAEQLADTDEFVALLKSPLAERAAKEARAEEAEGKTMEQREKEKQDRREKQAKKFSQTLFGQKMTPGLALDKAKPGKPYPEFGTLHDID